MANKIVIIEAHPDSGSFTAALAEKIHREAESVGWIAEIIRLYESGFNPVLSVEEMQRRFSFDESVQEQQESVREAEVLVWVHPDWWGGMPAVLKGWIDRVFSAGFAFSFEEQSDGSVIRIPLLRGKAALAVITSDADVSEPVPAVGIWQKRIFAYTGLNPAEVLLFPEIRSSEYTVRTEFMQICKDTLREILAEKETP